MSERLTFSRSLYRPDAVRAAADAYATLATFTLEDLDSDEMIVQVTEPHPEYAATLADAFRNHVLFETIQLHRAENGERL
ncbi:MAG: HxsD-like protein [Myxococcota bacterium]